MSYHLLDPSWTVTLAGLLLQGVGNAFTLIASYSCTLASALALPTWKDDMVTYSTVSSLWTAAFALGNFLGPTLGRGGRLLQTYLLIGQ